MSSHTDQDLTSDQTQIVSGLIGRSQALQDLLTILKDNRFAILTGPPGAGKTELAMTTMKTFARYHYASLQGARSKESIWRVLALSLSAAIPADEQMQQSKDRVLHALKDQSSLLVLDDIHTNDEVQEVLNELVAVDGSHKILAIGRTKIARKPFSNLALKGLQTDDGVALFCVTARKSLPGFHAEPATLQTIAEIVDAVDGIPLAIVLAASRIKLMSVDRIKDRVISNSQKLSRSDATNPRHTSLHAALQSSWDELDPQSQLATVLLCRFQEGFSFETAEELLDPFVHAAAEEVLEDLINASFLNSAYTHQVTFSMLGIVRDFSRAKLKEHPRHDELLGHWRSVMRCRASHLANALQESDGVSAFHEMRALASTLLAECRDLVDEGQVDEAASLLCDLRYHAVFQGPARAFVSEYERARECSDPGVSAQIIATYGELCVLQGERLKAVEAIESLLRDTSLSDAHPIPYVELIRVYAMARNDRPTSEILPRLQQALQVARTQGDRFAQARILERLGFLSIRDNDVEQAWGQFGEAYEIFQAQSAHFFAAESATGLGYTELRRGRLTQAEEFFERGVEMQRIFGDGFPLASALFNLAMVHHLQGELAQAKENFNLSLAMWEQGGFFRHRILGLLRLGLVHLETQEHQDARPLLTAAYQEGLERKDFHNSSVAYVERAALDYFDGQPVDPSRIEAALKTIAVGVEADAYASGLTLLAACVAQRGGQALPFVNRLEELAALFSGDDLYLIKTVEALRDCARIWHCLSLAERSDQGARKQYLHRAYELAEPLFCDDEQIPSNPLVRLWVARLRRATAKIDEFVAPAERFDAMLTVHAKAMWYSIDHHPAVDLSTRQPLRRIMLALLQSAQQDPAHELDVDEIAAAGWPGETLNLATRRNRVYTAIRFLREMDLEDCLITGERGYRLSPDFALRVVSE